MVTTEQVLALTPAQAVSMVAYMQGWSLADPPSHPVREALGRAYKATVKP